MLAHPAARSPHGGTVQRIGKRQRKRKRQKSDRGIRQAHYREFLEPRHSLGEAPDALPLDFPEEPPDSEEPPDTGVREPRGPRPAAPAAAAELEAPDDEQE